MDVLLVISALLVAVAIGANDIANAIGTAVGANVLSYRRASLLAGLAVAVGALSAGGRTISTVGTGILDTTALGAGVLTLALFCAAATVAMATYWRYPVSTTQAVVGALAGTGLAAGLSVDTTMLRSIITVWTLLPVVSAFLSFLLFFAVKAVFLRLFRDRIFLYERVMSVLVVVSGIIVALSLGANNIGNVVGVLDARSALPLAPAVLLGAGCIALGAVFLSSRVVLTIGKSITTLDPLQAFVVQVSASLALALCTMLGIPVSLSQATVGSVIGVGLTRGRKAVNSRYVGSIIGSWVATPLLSFAAAYALFIIS